MKRLIYADLLNWVKSSNRKPLLLRGARQVGKTHVVRQLGQQFEHFVEINFEQQPSLQIIFDYDLDPLRILSELSIHFKKKIIPGNTLLFIDDVQENPKAIIALRYFFEQMPQLHVIVAGSLVDFAIEKVGMPVGRVEFLHMYPMSFLEYLMARGYSPLANEILHHSPSSELNPALHILALRLLGEYMAIGGMPRAVALWITQQDILLTEKALSSLKKAHHQDFSKYGKRHELKYLNLLYEQIPSRIGTQFKYSNLSTHYKKRELEHALHLLERSGIIHLVNQSSGNSAPLAGEADFTKFKIVMNDIGLNQAILGAELKDWFINPLPTFMLKGNITESFVGQELIAYSNPKSKVHLYYWHREQRGAKAEIDYLWQEKQQIYPIKIKCGHGDHQSLRMFLNMHPNSPYGIRFSTHNYSIVENIHSYPLYAALGIISDKSRLLDFLNLDDAAI